MPKLRICTVCGSEFMSHNGTEVCSEKCRMERKREQDRRGNERRYSKQANTPFDRICPACGKNFESLRTKYCSTKCAEQAKKEHVKENSDRYYTEHKKAGKE